MYHYVTKSREDFQVKTQRGGGAGITRDMTYFAKVGHGQVLEGGAEKRGSGAGKVTSRAV